MQQWEYKIETMYSVAFTETELNYWGVEGWELVGIYRYRDSSSMYAVFKRPK